jgi:hypothetical protein
MSNNNAWYERPRSAATSTAPGTGPTPLPPCLGTQIPPHPAMGHPPSRLGRIAAER